jgi:hypothetical protein
MLLDRLGNRVERGSLLCCEEPSALVVVTRVVANGDCHDVYGVILEWEWGAFHIGWDRLWYRVPFKSPTDQEVIREGVIR